MSRRRATRLEPVRGAGRSSSFLGILSGVLGGLGLLLLVALVGPGVSGPAGDDGPTPLPPAEVMAESSSESESEPEAAETDEAVVLPVVAENIYLSRDPFDPVVPEEEPGDGGNGGNGDSSGDGTDGTDGTDGDGSTDPDDGTNGDPIAPPAPDADSTCTGEEELVCDGQVVTLEGTSGSGDSRTASIKVNSTTYVVAVGDTFATHFTLLGFDGDCVNIRYGDDPGIESRLCPSASPLK
ncbi:MAG: hypothetical protein WD638_04635 [Nitriliruptoraceae bacterium]